jgi:ATP-dependent RNA helicase DeaD
VSTSLSPRTALSDAPTHPSGDVRATPPSFAQLGARSATLRALTQLGIETPTPIQERAIPPLLAGRDVIGQSRTGSGKTIAFGLPLVERVDPRQRQAQALVLVPTRELASQVSDVLASLDGRRGLRVAQLIGGRALGPQRQALLAGAQIVVGAPGRVLDHLRHGNLNLQALRYVVLDEADQMLDVGFAPDVERILAMAPAARQLALFTATLPAWTMRIAGRYLHDPVHVAAEADQGETPAASTLIQQIYAVPQGQRLDALKALLDRRRDAPGATLVFGRTKHGVKKLARLLAAQGYPVAALQGNMSQNARDRVVADFRAGHVPVLLATNVAARGLDVLSIAQVINYELPESAELFTHRIGRTGRMDREGEAITLIAPEDALAWRNMQRELRSKPQLQPWPHDEMPLPARQVQRRENAVAVEPEVRPEFTRRARPDANREDKRNVRPEARREAGPEGSQLGAPRQDSAAHAPTRAHARFDDAARASRHRPARRTDSVQSRGRSSVRSAHAR